MSQSPKVRVLIVEDDGLAARGIDARLSNSRRRQFECQTVQNVQAACGVLRGGLVDVVLLDMDLGPGQPLGLQLLAEILLCADTLPVLIVSGLDDEHTAEHALTIGAQDWVTKQEGIDGLSQRITRSIARQARTRQLIEEAKTMNEAIKELNAYKTVSDARYDKFAASMRRNWITTIGTIIVAAITAGGVVWAAFIASRGHP